MLAALASHVCFSLLGVLTPTVFQQQVPVRPPVLSTDCFDWPPIPEGVNSSPFAAPGKTDTTFVVNQDTGLDTGCTFHSGSPLLFSIPVDRHVGIVSRLKAHGFIGQKALLQMPAFDVDFDAATSFAPERDRVYFNNHLVTEEFLTGTNNTWKLNTFQIPIEWVNFPPDPGMNHQVESIDNEIRIDIDTANGGQDVWCTAIDWASLTIEVARPVVMVHGIFSNGGVWNNLWVPRLNDTFGLPNDNRLSMGALDSIANNAQKIADVVLDDRRRWGVEKVVLVCHSKGGLDSRHYVEQNNTVSKVIQLGTPNAGSPLANIAQAILVILLDVPGAALANDLAGPAGIQLTTLYMAGYNRVHGANPNVEYTALAGDYDPNCGFFSSFRCALFRTALFVTGPGDVIVPITSVHALPYTANMLYSSAGLGDQSATHFGLHSSLNVFNGLEGTLASEAPGGEPGPSIPLPTTTAIKTGVIQQGQTQAFDLPVDHPGASSIMLLYRSGDLDMVLTSPSGVSYDEATATGNPSVVHGEGPFVGGLMEAFLFPVTETGLWHVAVRADSVVEPSGSASYAVTAVLDDAAITFEGSFDADHVSAGQDIVLRGTLRNAAQPVLGADVTARIKVPDATLQQLTLVDDGVSPDTAAGDGVYSGVLGSPTVPGTYLVSFEATGQSAGAPFSREAFGIATVAESGSSLVGGVTDVGVDSDGDGLFNELVVTVAVDSALQRDYRLVGELTDTAGNVQRTSRVVTLPVGVQNVDLHFDGAALFKNGVNGPYTLSRLILLEEGGDDILLLDEKVDVYQTAAYLFTEFEHGPIVFTGHGTDVGMDTNGNGLFDVLNVHLEVLIEVADFYQWSGRLVDPSGVEVGFASGAASLAHGFNQLAFNFAGSQIGQHGTGGPYTVRDVLISGGSQSLVAGEVYRTASYEANQFEGGHTNSPPDCSGAGGSSIALWPPDHEMQLIDVLAAANVTDPDNDPVSLVVDAVTQDELREAPGPADGHTFRDAAGLGGSSVYIRRERSSLGNGRVYNIHFTASDSHGATCQGILVVTVPREPGQPAIDDGQCCESTLN